MSKHEYNYSHSVWGLHYVICEKCKKKLLDYESEIDDTECKVDTFVQNDYSAGFDFAEKSDKEIRRILGSGNINDPDISR